jgi:hypothetical protein
VLDVEVIHADVADVRHREGDDLLSVRGVGNDLLIARKRGVKAELTDSVSRGSQASSPEDFTGL